MTFACKVTKHIRWSVPRYEASRKNYFHLSAIFSHMFVVYRTGSHFTKFQFLQCMFVAPSECLMGSGERRK